MNTVIYTFNHPINRLKYRVYHCRLLDVILCILDVVKKKSLRLVEYAEQTGSRGRGEYLMETTKITTVLVRFFGAFMLPGCFYLMSQHFADLW